MNSLVGVAALQVDDATRAVLERIQNELFDLGADLATPGDIFEPSEMVLRIVQSQVDRIEAEIDRMNAALEPLRSFILPGGNPASAAVHVARSAARRAERRVVAAARRTSLNPLARIYLNRLSDHLFVLARWLAKDRGGDVLWRPGVSR